MKSRTLYWIEPKKFIPQSFTPIFISFRSFRKKWKRRRSSHRAKSPLQINPSNAFQKKEEEEEEIYDLDYLERPLDDGCSYSRRKHEHSETWSPVCASWSAYFRREYRSHCPSPCPLCPSPWRPREASPPTSAPCWRIQGRRSRPTSSSGVENYPTSFEQFLPRFPLRKPFRPTPSFARKNLPVSVSLPLLLSPMYSLYFLKRKKKKSTTNSSPPPWEFLLSIHFQFIVSLLLLLLLEVNTWSSFLWFTFSSLLETRFERRFVEKLSGGTISSAGGFLIVPRVRVGERRRWRRGVFPPRFLPPSRDSGGARLKVSTRWERVERFVEKSLRLRAKVRTLWRSNMWRVHNRESWRRSRLLQISNEISII